MLYELSMCFLIQSSRHLQRTVTVGIENCQIFCCSRLILPVLPILSAELPFAGTRQGVHNTLYGQYEERHCLPLFQGLSFLLLCLSSLQVDASSTPPQLYANTSSCFLSISEILSLKGDFPYLS